MALFLDDRGGFRAEMTPQEHFNALHRKPTATATRVLPPTSEYTKLLQDQWNEAFRPDGPDGEFFEENWDFIEKIFAPLYFPQRDWVPDVPNRLKDLQRRYPSNPEIGICLMHRLVRQGVSFLNLLDCLKLQPFCVFNLFAAFCSNQACVASHWNEMISKELLREGG
jgi:hypothetical protein